MQDEITVIIVVFYKYRECVFSLMNGKQQLEVRLFFSQDIIDKAEETTSLTSWELIF